MRGRGRAGWCGVELTLKFGPGGAQGKIPNAGVTCDGGICAPMFGFTRLRWALVAASRAYCSEAEASLSCLSSVKKVSPESIPFLSAHTCCRFLQSRLLHSQNEILLLQLGASHTHHLALVVLPSLLDAPCSQKPQQECVPILGHPSLLPYPSHHIQVARNCRRSFRTRGLP